MSKREDKIHQEAQRRVKTALESEQPNREEAYDDLRAYAGDQWPDNLRQERDRASRPVITVNRLPQFVNQIIGEGRLNETSIKVIPVDSETDPALAHVMEGLIQSIESESTAQTSYESALEHSGTTGIGAFRIVTEYEHDRTFNQVIRIKRINDPFSVYFDPNAQEYDKRDADWAFVNLWMSEEAFKAKFPKETPSDWELGGLGDNYHWTKENQVRVCEYYTRKKGTKTLWLLQDGTVVDTAEVIYDEETYAAMGNPVIQKRKADDITIERYLLSGGGILEGPEIFPSKYIPIIPVTGPEVLYEGHRYYWSLIRWAKTPQQLYNFWLSNLTEKYSLGPKAPFMLTPEQISGHENMYRDANLTNFGYMLYNNDPEAPGRPERITPTPVQPADTQLVQQAIEDMYATTGIYPAALGMAGPEVSGVAIGARQSESDVSTFTWIDNLHRSIEHAGRVIVDMIPRVYDTERTVRIVGPDQKTVQWLTVNQVEGTDPATGEPIINNNITASSFDVRLETGPASKSQREESAKQLTVLGQAAPQVVPAIADILVKNMDFKDSDKAAERIEELFGWKQQGPPQPDPMQELELAKKQEDLRSKQLGNAQKEVDLAQDIPPLTPQAVRTATEAVIGEQGGSR